MEHPQNIVVIGTGGSSLDILDTIDDLNRTNSRTAYRCTGFLDDNDSLWGKLLHGVPVLGPLLHASELKDCYFVNGIGTATNFWKKDAIIAKTGIPQEKFATIVHPSASVSKSASLGWGTVVFQHVTITTNVKIGSHVIILPNSVISHDDIVGDYSCITGGVCVSGGVRIGQSCYLGSNSTVIGNIEVGDYSLIGMGSVVLESVPPNCVFVGNPARFLRSTMER